MLLYTRNFAHVVCLLALIAFCGCQNDGKPLTMEVTKLVKKDGKIEKVGGAEKIRTAVGNANMHKFTIKNGEQEWPMEICVLETTEDLAVVHLGLNYVMEDGLKQDFVQRHEVSFGQPVDIIHRANGFLTDDNQVGVLVTITRN